MKYKNKIYFLNDKTSLFGKLITFYNLKSFGKSECTHVGFITDENDTAVEIYEAGPKGFLPSWYGKDWLENCIETKEVILAETTEKLKDLRENCEKYRGIRYGFLDILGIALSALFGWRVLGITGKNAIICSEAVSRIIYDSTKNINIAQEYDVVYDAVSPQMIFNSKYIKRIN